MLDSLSTVCMSLPRESLSAKLWVYAAESMEKPQTHLVSLAGAALVSVTRSPSFHQQSVPGYEPVPVSDISRG
jgi:hypothetical protein